jgi:hypothetical protein
MVMEEIVLAYCHSTADPDIVASLSIRFLKAYQFWIGASTLPVFANPCLRLRFLWESVRDHVKKIIGISADQILWSEIPELLNISNSEWQDLMKAGGPGRNKILQRLHNVILSSEYAEIFKRLV